MNPIFAESVFRSLITASYMAVVIIDDTGTIVFGNTQALSSFGYGDELVGQSLNVLIPSRFHCLHTGQVKGFMASPVSRPMGTMSELFLRRSDGSECAVDISLTPFDQDGRRYVCAFIRDISLQYDLAQKQKLLLEISRAQSETTKYEERIKATVNLVVPTIADTCVIYLYEGASFVPKAVAHAGGENEALFRLAAHAQNAETNALFGPIVVARSGKPQLFEDLTTIDLKLFGLDPENTEMIRTLGFRSYLCVPLEVRGKVIGALSLGSFKANRFGVAHLKFAELVANRSALALENARLYKEAQESIRLREEILALVSHDLRSPLATISMANSLNSESETKDIIERSARQMDRLIGDLMDFAKIESGSFGMEFALQPAAAFVSRAIEMVGHHLRERNLRVVVDLDPTLPGLKYDISRITQVFYNLLGNACKFSPSGGEIKVHGYARGEMAVFSVIDSGPGIAPVHLPHVFDKFFQVGNGARKGAGLGLYIARKIVEAHGGKISVESMVGAGATFSISLPLNGGKV